MQVGEALADLVAKEVISDLDAMGILQGAAGRMPDDACRQRCFASFRSLLRRLALLEALTLDMQFLSPIQEVLPRVLPQVQWPRDALPCMPFQKFEVACACESLQRAW